MSDVLAKALMLGVVFSAIVIAIGTLLFLVHYSTAQVGTYLVYNPNQIPHGNFGVGLPGIEAGVSSLNPFSVIELGLLILLATPVTRVFLSILLFYFEGDIRYVYITLAVFAILLFSMLVVPLIPSFGG